MKAKHSPPRRSPALTRERELVRVYLETLLWSSTHTGDDKDSPDNGEPLDSLAEERGATWTFRALLSAARDLRGFQYSMRETLSPDELAEAESVRSSDPNGTAASYLAHNFALTRNGHGAGFWDGRYSEPLGRKLTELCRPFGEQYPYLNGTDIELAP